jgi:hypothetical protein
MRVTKRNGRVEDMKFDKVTTRISNLTDGLSSACDSTKVAQQVFSSMYDGIKTQEIDTLSAEICIGMITSDPDYEILATRIVASNIQKQCPKNFVTAMRNLHKAGVVTDEIVRVADQVKEHIKSDRDFDFGYFGLKHWKSPISRKWMENFRRHHNLCLCVSLLVFMAPTSPP